MAEGRGRLGAARDGIDVERLLVWVYRDQKAGRIMGRGVGLSEAERVIGVYQAEALRGGMRSNTDAVVRFAGYGTMIDCAGGAARDPGHLHADAEAVHGIVCGLRPPSMIGLLIRFAERAERPSTDTGPAWRCLPVYNRRGRPKILRECDVGISKRKVPAWCLLDIVDRRAYVQAVKAAYAAWFKGLAGVGEALAGAGVPLRRFEVTGLGAPSPEDVWPEDFAKS